MTTAQRREEILALLNQADAPIAAKDLAARFGVSRQVIVQDLAVIRTSRPNIISTNRGYILQQQETGCLREFKVRHTPEQAEQELTLQADTLREEIAELEQRQFSGMDVSDMQERLVELSERYEEAARDERADTSKLREQLQTLREKIARREGEQYLSLIHISEPTRH